jgi:hypothetical protein
MATLVPITRPSSNTDTPAASAFAREGRAQVVDPRRPPGAGCLDRGRPLAAAEVVQVHQPPGGRREQQRRIQARRERVERVERPPAERHLAPAPGCLAQLHHLAARHGAPHVEDAGPAVDVATLERLPCLRSLRTDKEPSPRSRRVPRQSVAQQLSAEFLKSVVHPGPPWRRPRPCGPR